MTNSLLKGVVNLFIAAVCIGIIAVVLGADASLVTNLLKDIGTLVAYAVVGITLFTVVVRSVS